MAKLGFGLTSGTFDSVLQMNIGLQLPILDNEQIITSIMAAYGQTDPTNPVVLYGRLLIVSGNFTNIKTAISPVSASIPANVGSPLFDIILNDKTSFIDFGPGGFSLAAGSPYTVILAAAICQGDTFPTVTGTNGFLNVQGFAKDREQPFKDLR